MRAQGELGGPRATQQVVKIRWVEKRLCALAMRIVEKTDYSLLNHRWIFEAKAMKKLHPDMFSDAETEQKFGSFIPELFCPF